MQNFDFGCMYMPITTSILIALAASIVAVVLKDSATPDYEHYKAHFETINSIFDADPLYSASIYLARSLGFSYDLYLWVITLFALVVKFLVVYRLRPSLLAFFVPIYLCSLFLLHEYIQVRLAVALAFVYLFINIEILEHKKTIWKHIAGGAAVTVHMSTLPLLIAIILLRSKSLVAVAFLAMLISALTFAGIFFEDTAIFIADATDTDFGRKIGAYLYEAAIGGEGGYTNITSVQFLTAVFTMGAVARLQFWSRVEEANKRLLWLAFTLTGIGLVVRILTQQNPVISFRLMELFSFLLPLAQSIVAWELSSRGRLFWCLSFVSLCVLSGLYVYAGRGLL